MVYRMQVETPILAAEQPVYTYTRMSWNNKHNFSTLKKESAVEHWTTAGESSATFWVCSRLFPCQVSGCVLADTDSSSSPKLETELPQGHSVKKASLPGI